MTSAQQSAIGIVDRIATRLSEMNVSEMAISAMSTDVCWRPSIPQGHTSYTWTSKCGQPGYVTPVDVNSYKTTVAVPSTAITKGSAPIAGPSPDFDGLDLRVGTIVNVKVHPDADGLYVEQIDVGEGAPREIVSGLVNYIPIHQMINKSVVVFANLKPNKLRGIVSNGMVMCASTDDKSVVELLTPPLGAAPGDRVLLDGSPASCAAMLPEQVNPKKKVNAWTVCAPKLRTDSRRVAVFDGQYDLVVVGYGPCTSASLADATIS